MEIRNRLRSVAKTLEYVAGHPLNCNHKLRALWDFFAWQASTRMLPGAAVVPYVDDTVLVVSRGMRGATGAIYCGLHEYEDMGFTLHCLRQGDLFVDVGANVGTYTILASGAAAASSVSFEPNAIARGHLERNVRVNAIESHVEVVGSAVGETVGSVELTGDQDTENRIVAGQVARTSVVDRVPMTTLDGALASRQPTLVKIDVEGYEANVVRGARQSLTCPSILACIVEVNDASHSYGQNEGSFFSVMLELGYQAYSYDPMTRNLALCGTGNGRSNNTLFIRQLDAVVDRLKSARRFCIHRRGTI